MSRDQLRATVASLMGQARSDLTELVAIPSVADPKEYDPALCAQAAQWVIDAFTAAGLQEVAASPTPDGSLAVHGNIPAPQGAPTVLLYCHYDVQPPLDHDAWQTPVFELTEKDGRWYGRGSADCKGNIVAHLTALRALTQELGEIPCGVRLLCEGSEEQGTGGLEAFVPQHPDLAQADTILVCDTGNFAVGLPTLTTSLRGMTSVDVTVRGLGSQMHSGMFGGPAPDPLAGLIMMLASMRDAQGNTIIDGLDNTQHWSGIDYPPEQFRADSNVLAGADLLGADSVADMLWARPAVTVLGIDVPSVGESAAAIQAEATARVSLRVPPGIDARAAQDALVAHLQNRVPWHLECEIERVALGDPFVGSLSGPAYTALKAAMEEGFGRDLVIAGQGGSIPLCTVFAQTCPDAEIFLLGVEEPLCLIHAPNESVDPAEIEHTALSIALFLVDYAASTR